MPFYRKKKYYKKRYYRRKRYRGNKNYEYMYAKINTQAAIIMENNSSGSAGIGWRFAEAGTWTNTSPEIVISQVLKNNTEYIKYQNIYNEVKLLGVSCKIVPNYRTVGKDAAANAFQGFVNVYFNSLSGFAGSILEQDPLICCPEDNSYKYWYNKDQHYYPCDLTQPQLETGLVNMGMLYVGGSPNTTLQSYCPSWNAYIKIYVRFKKNRLNQ